MILGKNSYGKLCETPEVISSFGSIDGWFSFLTISADLESCIFEYFGVSDLIGIWVMRPCFRSGFGQHESTFEG